MTDQLAECFEDMQSTDFADDADEIHFLDLRNLWMNILEKYQDSNVDRSSAEATPSQEVNISFTATA